jgi:5-methylcytosine-specific restriction endonuclease McrA
MYKCLHCKKECESSRQKTNKYCSIQCQVEYQYTTRVKEWLVEGKDWKGMIPNWVRRALAEKFGYKCSLCNITEYNSKPIVLEVDHKDGDHSNNTIKNLRLICPNCHSQTPTYKNRNIGSGRTSRRKL